MDEFTLHIIYSAISYTHKKSFTWQFQTHHSFGEVSAINRRNNETTVKSSMETTFASRFIRQKPSSLLDLFRQENEIFKTNQQQKKNRRKKITPNKCLTKKNCIKIKWQPKQIQTWKAVAVFTDCYDCNLKHELFDALRVNGLALYIKLDCKLTSFDMVNGCMRVCKGLRVSVCWYFCMHVCESHVGT